MIELGREDSLAFQARNTFAEYLENTVNLQLPNAISGSYLKTTYEGHPALHVRFVSDLVHASEVGEYTKAITEDSASYQGLGGVRPQHTEWSTKLDGEKFSMQTTFFWPGPGAKRAR